MIHFHQGPRPYQPLPPPHTTAAPSTCRRGRKGVGSLLAADRVHTPAHINVQQVRKRRTCSQVGSKLKNVVVVVVLFGVGLCVFLSVDCHHVNTPVEDSSIAFFFWVLILDKRRRRSRRRGSSWLEKEEHTSPSIIMASSLPIVRPMSLYLSVKKIVRGFTLFFFFLFLPQHHHH